MRFTMTNDPEIIAMSQVLEVFKFLDNGQRRRVIDWVSSRFGIETAASLVPVVNEADSVPAPNIPEPVELPQSEVTAPSLKGVPDATEESTELETIPQIKPIEQVTANDDVDPQKNLGLKRYGSIETLFLSSSVNTVSSKILLCAAYLQEKLNIDELSSYDINSRLKKLGYGVANISNSLNTLIKKDPPLIVQTRKIGDSKQAKRRFKVTEEGLKVARTYLRGKPRPFNNN